MAAVLLKSIGCRTNQEEIAGLGALLSERGHRVVGRPEEADVVVINTCVVTALTEAKTRRYITGLARLLPRVKICVTGCMAQVSPDDVRLRLGATWVVGNSRKNDIPSIIGIEPSGIFHGEPTAAEPPVAALVNRLPPPGEGGRTRFFLKIQEGCDCRCAYCIVPAARGPSKSAAFADVKTAFVRALDAGYKEIVLTGTHIGQYRSTEFGDFTDLAVTLADTPGDYRIRLSSLDPRELSDSLLDLVAHHPRMCRHLHLSIQSLAPAVLAAMNRPLGDFDAFMERLASFRRRNPGVGLGGDFIVGFPGETPARFEETGRAVEEIGFAFGHVFRYSRRPGTVAPLLPGQVDERVKTERSDVLRAAIEKCRAAFVSAVSGDVHTVLVESTRPTAGLASNYLRLEVPGCRAAANSWLRVNITGGNPANGRLLAVCVE
jgi:threonylcarbamoyladenosine tRNA methylthiotransferase MtaB